MGIYDSVLLLTEEFDVGTNTTFFLVSLPLHELDSNAKDSVVKTFTWFDDWLGCSWEVGGWK